MKLPIALALLSAKASHASWDWSKFASKSTPNLPQNVRALETDVPCTHSARKIKIQSTTGEPLSFREVRVFSDEVNVAIGKTATQSSDLDDSSGASKAVDGKWRTKATTGDDEGCSTWWEVDLEESTSINKVQIVNPDKSCKLSYATISLLDADGETVWAKVVGDTCDKGWVVRKFEYECPTASPTTTTNPTAAPTMPTFDPNYDCQSPDGCWEFLTGFPLDANLNPYVGISSVSTTEGAPATVEECKHACPKTPTFRGLMFFDASYIGGDGFGCICHYDLGTLPPLDDIFDGVSTLPGSQSGTGPVSYASGEPSFVQAGKWHLGLSTFSPTKNPTAAPSTPEPTPLPTPYPTNNPTAPPTPYPTNNPTAPPTDNPTDAPTKSPTLAPISAVGEWEYYGNGYCADSNLNIYDSFWYMDLTGGFLTDDQCKASCPVTDALLGSSSYNVPKVNEYYCECYYEDGHLPSNTPAGFNRAEGWTGTGPVAGLNPNLLNREGLSCYAYKSEFKLIKNSQNNGMCIGLQGGSTVANTAVWMYPCNPADLTTQKWHIDPTSGRIRPQGNKDMCMQSNGWDTAATIETCSDNDNQRFTLTSEGRIQPKQGTGSSIGVQGGCGSITSVRVELQPNFADNGGCESQQKWIYV